MPGLTNHSSQSWQGATESPKYDEGGSLWVRFGAEQWLERIWLELKKTLVHLSLMTDADVDEVDAENFNAD